MRVLDAVEKEFQNDEYADGNNIDDHHQVNDGFGYRQVLEVALVEVVSKGEAHLRR